MRIVVHKNDMKNLIKTPTISIMESEMTSAEEIVKKIDPTLTPIILKETDLPDRWFRDAWDIVDKKLIVNIDKAKDIHKERIRIARTIAFPALDVEYQRSTETTNNSKKTKEIIAKKQQLRDAPLDPRIDQVTTTEELKAIWPEFLGAHYDINFDLTKAK